MHGLECAGSQQALNAARVYIGRPSKWGNPFVIGCDGSRADVIAKYCAWIVVQPALMNAFDGLAAAILLLARTVRVPRRRAARTCQQAPSRSQARSG